MATKRKKKEKVITYKVIQRFKSTINERTFNNVVDDEIELNEFEHSILKVLVEEI